MKHLKTYEIIERENEKPTIPIGKFVICDDDYKDDEMFNDFIINIVGKVIEYDFGNNPYYYKIEYDDDDVPVEYAESNFLQNDYGNYFRYAGETEFIKVGDTKEELEMFINTKKYNI